MRRAFAFLLSLLLIVLVAPTATAAVEAEYDGGGTFGVSVTMDRGAGPESLNTKLFELDVTGQGTLPAYCVDIQTTIRETTYEEQGWEAAGASKEKILWVLKHSYPTVDVATLAAAANVPASELQSDEAIGATQAAIWTFSDGATYIPGTNTIVNAVVAYLTGGSNTGLSTPPAPSISLTPTSATGQAGSRIGPFTLTVSDGGSADLSLSPARSDLKLYKQASGGNPTSSASNGDQVWIDVPAGTNPAAVELKATTTTTAFAGRVFTRKSGDPSQKLVLATDTEATATARAAASWTRSPGVPSVSVSSKCLPGGGASGTITLTNDAPRGGSSVEFTVNVPGRAAEMFTVDPNRTRTVQFTLAEDATSRTIQVTAPGMTDFSQEITTDCLVSNPQAVITARCEAAPAGGATVTIDLSNPVTPGKGQTAISTKFTVFVNGTKQTISGASQWVVQPNATRQLRLTLPEGTAVANVVVKADDKTVAEKAVPTDCAVNPKPAATITAKCVAEGGASVTVNLSNNPTLATGQSSVSVIFTIEVDGTLQSTWTVAPGETKELTLPLREDSGDHTVVVKADGKALTSKTVSTDCVVPAVPKATITAKCLVEGGASVQIDLANGAKPTDEQFGTPTTFTVFVDDKQQTIDGKDAWTLKPGADKALSLTLPEDSGDHTVVVKADGAQVASKVVSTNCNVSNPAFTTSSVCGQVTVTYTNVVTAGGDQYAVDAKFSVVVDGGNAQDVVVKPNAPETIVYPFGEDTGTHTVAVNGGEPIVVQTDCLENTAKLTIRKVVVGATPEQQSTPFDFVASSANGEQRLTVPAGTATTVEYTVPVNEGLLVSVTEQPLVGWHLLGVPVCTPDQVTPTAFGAPEGRETIATPTGEVFLTNGSAWTCTFTNEPDGQRIDKTAQVAEGTAVESGEQITYSVKVANVSSVATAEGDVVDTLPAGVTLVEGSISDGGKASADGSTITWSKVSIGAQGARTFTYQVTVKAGFGTPSLVNKVTWLGQSDQTVHPVKALRVDVASLCRADAPYYTVTVDSQNLGATDPATGKPYVVTVEWLQADDKGNLILQGGQPVPAVDPATNQRYVDTYPLVDGKLATPELLWKGAKLDADGTPIDWPGWDKVDGEWVQVADGGVRPAAILRVSVNPTVNTVALYPPATVACSANPPQGVEDEVEAVEEAAAVSGTEDTTDEEALASTGAELASLLIVAMLSVLAGAALLTARRRSQH